MKRREFLKGSLLMLGLGGCKASSRPLAGASRGPDSSSGHRLRDGKFPSQPSRSRKLGTAILGAGIAGLSAAWKLERSGYSDFEVFDLEERGGGNSRWFDYPESAAPLAAHYLPIPTVESRAVRELLEEMGIYLGQEPDGSPRYDTRHLCHSPQERIFLYGRWQEGLFPSIGASDEDFQQLESFQAVVQAWQEWRDPQGRKAFALPLAYSADTPELRALDQESFASFADRHGWTSPRLRWLLEYGCRDDYGTLLEQTSAWAGLHYHCSRDGGGFSEGEELLVWPEGNGHLARHLLGVVGERLRPRSLVVAVRPGQGFDYLDLGTSELVRVEADQIVYALPSFTREKTMGQPQPAFSYSAWVTANLVLERYPEELTYSGAELAWDNVFYESPSLGYVVATHQSLATTRRRPTVFTWYRPMLEGEPAAMRKELLRTDWAYWRDLVLAEFDTVYPGIESMVRRLDVCLLGHAMVRPTPGFLWGEPRRRAAEPVENVSFAHSDLSGISIFEEAQYHGVRAGQEVLSRLKRDFQSSL
ncbi:MAG: NAD(P)-binding protein [Vulcanimicrobiota bacterium]